MKSFWFSSRAVAAVILCVPIAIVIALFGALGMWLLILPWLFGGPTPTVAADGAQRVFDWISWRIWWLFGLDPYGI